MTHYMFHLLFLLVVNIPFGIWRGAVKKFSIQWFLAIHIPVLGSVLLRKQLHIEYTYIYLPIALIMFFVSQRIGVMIYEKRFKPKSEEPTEG